MFSKRQKRKITVGGRVYYWSASGDDGWINLCVMTTVPGSPKLICYFEYHQDETPFERGGRSGVSLSDQFVITPYIVRQTIEYGLANAWDPFHRGKDLFLGHIDDKIDLRFGQNKENEIKSHNKRLSHDRRE
ncbi:MAG: hypothetical protein GY722_02380 [bacterium]|nr:hypothetical protein [bacterium]